MLQEAIISNVISYMPTSAPAESSEIDNAMATVMLAFSADPVARWVWPDPADYIRYFPEFIRVFAGRSFSNGTAIVTPDNAGAALWLPPDVSSDEEGLTELIERSVSDEIKRDLYPVIEGMAAFHPDEPHWYLPMIGVDPGKQNRGTGSALMAYSLLQCDADGLPAYLESSNPRNISLYERFGFEQIGTIRHGDSAPLFPMLRKARR
jgi:GNAT superfamily N-acetyltransferase